LPAPVLVGAATAAVALAGIGLLYLHAAGLQAAQAPLATLPIAHAHTVLVDEAGTYWVGHHDGLLRSADGRSWRPVVPQGDIMAIVSDPSRLLLFGHEVMLESTDGGASWTVASHDLPDADVHGAQRGILGIYAYVEGRGLFRSTDGRHWEQSSDPVAPGVGGLAVVPAADGGDAVFLAAAGTVLRTADGGRTWAAAAGAGNAALTGTVRSLAGDAGGGALYAATTDGLFRSTSRGADWVKLPFRGSLAAVGARGAQVAVVDDRGQFFRSRDGGGAWTAEP
jgi:photosystem II stability/assembly factor-like uncharacterized protein